jgi:hypothetical protein
MIDKRRKPKRNPRAADTAGGMTDIGGVDMDDSTLEEWRSLPGWDCYEVSDKGRVRKSVSVTPHGHVRKCRVLKQDFLGYGGYARVQLRRDGRHTSALVHRLMAMAFIPNPALLPLVRHLDDDRRNNTLSNLEWGTPADNEVDKVRNGRCHNSNKTHCKYGHEYSDINTVVRSGSRKCRTCERQKAVHGRRNRDYELVADEAAWLETMVDEYVSVTS